MKKVSNYITAIGLWSIMQGFMWLLPIEDVPSWFLGFGVSALILAMLAEVEEWE